MAWPADDAEGCCRAPVSRRRESSSGYSEMGRPTTSSGKSSGEMTGGRNERIFLGSKIKKRAATPHPLNSCAN